MLELIKSIERSAAVHVDDYLPLTYEQRQKRWLRARLASGDAIGLRRPRGNPLRGGDLLAAADGRVIEVIALPEAVIHASFATPGQLIRAAYHLGNRHAVVQISSAYLRIQKNHVLEAMLTNLGATLIEGRAPFEPECGAYFEGHMHESNQAGSGGKIHEYDDHEK